MNSQFNIYGSKGSLKMLTNPWLPTQDNNKVILSREDTNQTTEINVYAQRSLYTYQVDAMNSAICNQDKRSKIYNHLKHSLGNAIALENWRQAIKHAYIHED